MSEDPAIVDAIASLIEEFKSIEDISISDVTTLRNGLFSIITNATSEDFSMNAISSIIGSLLTVFYNEGLTLEDYEKFQLMFDAVSTEDELIADLQNLIYSFLIDIAQSSIDKSAIVKSTTLSLSKEYNTLLLNLVIVLLSGSDSGLPASNASKAYATFLTKFSPIRNSPCSASQIETVWSAVNLYLSNSLGNRNLLSSINANFSAILLMVQNLNYSSFASGIYEVNTIIELFTAAATSAVGDTAVTLVDPKYGTVYLSAIDSFTSIINKSKITDTDYIMGKDLILTFSRFAKLPAVTLAYTSSEIENILYLCLPIFNAYADIKKDSGSSLILPSLFSTAITPKLGLFAIKFPAILAEVFFGRASTLGVFVFIKLQSTPESPELLAVQSLFNQRIAQEEISATEIIETANDFFNILSGSSTIEKDDLTSTYATFSNNLTTLTDTYPTILASAVEVSYYFDWIDTLNTKIEEILTTTFIDGDYPTPAIITVIVTQIQLQFLTMNNISSNGVNTGNALQMLIEILEYLSLFMTPDQLDILAEFMNDYISGMPEESEREAEAEESMKMWIQIGVAIAMLIVTIIITVCTFGAGTAAAVALDVTAELALATEVVAEATTVVAEATTAAAEAAEAAGTAGLTTVEEGSASSATDALLGVSNLSKAADEALDAANLILEQAQQDLEDAEDAVNVLEKAIEYAAKNTTKVVIPAAIDGVVDTVDVEGVGENTSLLADSTSGSNYGTFADAADAGDAGDAGDAADAGDGLDTEDADEAPEEESEDAAEEEKDQCIKNIGNFIKDVVLQGTIWSLINATAQIVESLSTGEYGDSLGDVSDIIISVDKVASSLCSAESGEFDLTEFCSSFITLVLVQAPEIINLIQEDIDTPEFTAIATGVNFVSSLAYLGLALVGLSFLLIDFASNEVNIIDTMETLSTLYESLVELKNDILSLSTDLISETATEYESEILDYLPPTSATLLQDTTNLVSNLTSKGVSESNTNIVSAIGSVITQLNSVYVIDTTGVAKSLKNSIITLFTEACDQNKLELTMYASTIGSQINSIINGDFFTLMTNMVGAKESNDPSMTTYIQDVIYAMIGLNTLKQIFSQIGLKTSPPKQSTDVINILIKTDINNLSTIVTIDPNYYLTTYGVDISTYFSYLK